MPNLTSLFVRVMILRRVVLLGNEWVKSKGGDTPPNSLMDSTASPKGENNGRIRSWGILPRSQHFEGRGVYWNSGMGIRRSDNQVNYSHQPAQTKQQVGQC